MKKTLKKEETFKMKKNIEETKIIQGENIEETGIIQDK